LRDDDCEPVETFGGKAKGNLVAISAEEVHAKIGTVR
jgi:hypothetical protein